MDPVGMSSDIEARLRRVADPMRAVHEKAYLKSDLEFFGVRVPEIRASARALQRGFPGIGHPELIAVVTALWERPVLELRLAAVELLRLFPQLLSPEDVPLLERLLRESRTWALVDPLASLVVADLVARYPPALDAVLRRWAADADFWLRRASLLAHLPQLRRGEGDFERFAAFAEQMLEEKEFFIRKAIGWVLRETGKRRPDLVTAWLLPRASRVSGVTIREAVKYLPADDRSRIEAVRTARRSS